MTNSQANAIKMANLTRSVSSAEYQESVPEILSDGSNLQAVGRAITNYTPNMNEFVSNLINRIGLTNVRSMDFTDPFAALEKERLTKGDTVQDIFVEAKPGEDYQGIPEDGGTVDPFIISRPIVFADYNSDITRRIWGVTIAEDFLRQAFVDVNKLDEFMRKAIDSMFVSYQTEKWARTKTSLGTSTLYTKPDQLIRISPTVGEAQYKEALLAMKNARSRINYPSRKYNKQGVLNRATKGDTYLVITSDFYNAIGVDVLSGVFNLGQATTDFDHVIEVDSFTFNDLGLNLPATPQPGLVACVFDGYYVKNHDMIDGRMKTIENPRGLYWNYFLHWWTLRYFSPFGNIIGITTEAAPAA